MNVAGQGVVAAPAEAVFGAICDPTVLLTVIPGCEGVEQVSAEAYRARFALRVPGFTGRYDATVRLVRAERPSSGGVGGPAGPQPGVGELEGRVDGSSGSVVGRATFRLTPSGAARTIVDYRASAIVSGPLARLDGRFLEGIVGSLVGQAIERLGAQLATASAARDAAPLGAAR